MLMSAQRKQAKYQYPRLTPWLGHPLARPESWLCQSHHLWIPTEL